VCTIGGFSCAVTCEGEVKHAASVAQINNGKASRDNHLCFNNCASLGRCQRCGRVLHVTRLRKQPRSLPFCLVQLGQSQKCLREIAEL
jgi:hypothetical protein